MKIKISGGLFVITVFLLAVAVSFAKYSGGSGDPNDPYRLSTPSDLLALAADNNDYDKSFVLTADINLQGHIFTSAVILPDTSPSYGFQGITFAGIFDGNGFTIQHLTINAGTNDYIGLFGVLSPASQVKNLGFEDCNISGQGDYTGALVGFNYADITNCHASDSLTGGGNVGGLVGYNENGDFNSCYSTVTISGNSFLGGIIGENYEGIITHCYSTAVINGTGNSIGGLVGQNYGGSIRYWHSTGSVSGQEYVGGLVGKNYISGSIVFCYSTAGVTGTVDSYFVGGLVGDSEYSNISGSYSSGPVSGTNYLGGFAGQNRMGSISACYSTGPVTTNGGSNVGGFAGFDESGSDIINCYFLNTSGPDNTFGTPLTDARLKQADSFNWDFNQIWGIVENQTYPFLRFYSSADFNFDGIVDLYDFAILASQWLK